jgi:hypothetical protein
MGSLVKSVVLGFIAGAIAYLVVHEGITLWLLNNGYTTRVPWSTEPSLITGSPQIVVDAAWGGLWGAIFGLILGSVPKGSMTLRGALLGLIGTAVIGTLIALPLIRGEQPFATVDVNALWPVLVVGTAFGAAAAWLYGFFTSGCRLP